MQTRVDTLPSNEKTTEWKKLRSESLMLRSTGAVLVGALALSLTACEERDFGVDTYESGTIEETRAKLGDSVLAQCLDETPYSINGSGAEWSKELFGQYHKGRTNAVIAITPETGGETLLLEQTLNVFSRPSGLFVSPLTNKSILEQIDCSPADLPGDKEDYVIKYKVEENTKKLKDHNLID